ncbi:MAG: putative bifunctional diguanylate cyclase/phosphodiesterase [Janthinobacterium lividum]
MRVLIRSFFPPRWKIGRMRANAAATVSIVAVGLCCLAGIAWDEARTRSDMQLSMQRALRITELRGIIAHLDELLTMSARVAALSGDLRWVQRYNESEPRLDNAITEAIALATPLEAVELARTTDDANRRLVELERASFVYDRANNGRAAWSLLDGREYADLKAIYSHGMEMFGADLENSAAKRNADLLTRARLEIVGLLLGGLILLAAAALAMRDQSRLRGALAHTEAIARHDSLTGLPNRLRFREHMEHTLTHLSRQTGGCALLYLDLDGFKGVNDVMGHAAGDALLCAVSSRLSQCTRDIELVARLGGDEFAIVQTDLHQPAAAEALADRLVRALRESFDIDGYSIVIGTSIGIALVDHATLSTDTLLHDADLALYRAKAEGRGTWRFFTADMDLQVRLRRALEDDLRKALALGQFEVFYQPLVGAGTQRLTAFEALLRWHHPQRGMVSPADFIPVAEEIGLIVEIGAWVLERACTDAAEWPAHISVAVNVSAEEFLKGDLLHGVQRALGLSKLAPARLELEITESVLLRDNNTTLATLHHVRSLGVRTSLDDFGTGYSSLSYLRQFPFDKVKIDQSFIRDIGRDGYGVEIIRAVIGLGRALGIKVLVEGVETAEQLRILRTEQCDELQGYMFGKPQPLCYAEEIIQADLLGCSCVQVVV